MVSFTLKMASDGYPFSLGGYRREVTSASDAAACWFNRGLNWAYGFHHQVLSLLIRCTFWSLKFIRQGGTVTNASFSCPTSVVTCIIDVHH